MVEEFLVDANNLIFLKDSLKIKHAEQYCEWIELLLTENWSPFTDNDGNQLLLDQLTERQVFTLMHHYVIMEEISKIIGFNEAQTMLNNYYKTISDILKEIHCPEFGMDMVAYINQVILNKFRKRKNIIIEFRRILLKEEYNLHSKKIEGV